MKTKLIYNFFSIFLIVTVLTASFITPDKAEAQQVKTSGDIAADCFTNILKQKIEAYAIGESIAAISAALASATALINVPVGDKATQSATSLTSSDTATTAATVFISQYANCIVHGLAQMAIDALNAKVVGLIQSGINGNPNYSQFLNGLYRELTMMIAQDLQDQIDGLALCDFGFGKPNIMLSTRVSSYQRFGNQITCPFPGLGLRNFYGDFSNGGWDKYEASLSDDSVNPFGQALMIRQELDTRTAETLDVKKQQLAQGAGFEPVIDPNNCTYPDGSNGPDGNYIRRLRERGDDAGVANAQRLYCATVTPGKTVGDQLSQVVGSTLTRLMTGSTVTTAISDYIDTEINNASAGIFKNKQNQ